MAAAGYDICGVTKSKCTFPDVIIMVMFIGIYQPQS